MFRTLGIDGENKINAIGNRQINNKLITKIIKLDLLESLTNDYYEKWKVGNIIGSCLVA